MDDIFDESVEFHENLKFGVNPDCNMKNPFDLSETCPRKFIWFPEE